MNKQNTWQSSRLQHVRELWPQQGLKSSGPGAQGQDVSQRLLVKLYRFLANQLHLQPSCAEEVFMSCSSQLPLSLSWMVVKMKFPGWEDRMAVVMGVIPDNARVSV